MIINGKDYPLEFVVEAVESAWAERIADEESDRLAAEWRETHLAIRMTPARSRAEQMDRDHVDAMTRIVERLEERIYGNHEANQWLISTPK